MSKLKLLHSKVNRLIELLEENEQIFFDERPFLTDHTLKPEINILEERRVENEIKIKQTIKSVKMDQEIPRETPGSIQKRIWDLDK